MGDPKVSSKPVDVPQPDGGIIGSNDLQELDHAGLSGLTPLFNRDTIQARTDVFMTDREKTDKRQLLDGGHKGRIRVINYDLYSFDNFFATSDYVYVKGTWYKGVKLTEEEKAQVAAGQEVKFNHWQGFKLDPSEPIDPVTNQPNYMIDKKSKMTGWFPDDLKFRVTSDGRIQFIPTAYGESTSWEDSFHQVLAEGDGGVGKPAFDALLAYLKSDAMNAKGSMGEAGAQIKSYYDAYLDQYAEVKKQIVQSQTLAASLASQKENLLGQGLVIDFSEAFTGASLNDITPQQCWDAMVRNGWLASAKSTDANEHTATFSSAEEAKKVFEMAASGKVMLDFTNAVDGINGGTDEDAMVAMIRFGWFKDATAVDIAKHTATFASHETAEKAVEAVFRTNQAEGNFGFGQKGFADPLTRSISYYYNPGANIGLDEPSLKDDAYLSTRFIWGLWTALTPEEEKKMTVVSKTPLGKLEFPNTEAELSVADLETELKRQEELSLSPQAFRYFTVVKDEHNQTVWKLVTRQVLLQGAQNPVSMPVQDAETLLSLPMESGSIPTSEELQHHLDVNGLDNIHHTDLVMGEDVNYAIVADERYLFKTRTQDGQEVLIVRVPTCNRDRKTGPLAVGSEQEAATLGYLTVDEASLISAFVSNIDPQGKSMMMSRSGEVEQEIYNPLTEKAEVAFAYKLSILGDSVPSFVPDAIRALVTSGYPIVLPPDATNEQVIKAAMEFFLDGWKTGEDFKWYMPGTAGWVPDPFTNEFFDFSDPRAWEDPEGLTEPVLGPDGKPLLDKDKKPITRPKTVKMGGMDVPRKRAAYLAYMFLAYMGKAEEFGLSATDQRDWQESLNDRAIESGKWLTGISVAISTLAMLGLQAWAVKQQRALMKEAQNMGVNDKGDQEEISKLMSDPNYMPSFVTPLLDLSGSKDPSPYFANPERDQQIRMLMRSLTGETGYSAAFLTGDAGVGKTEMMKEVQRRLLLPRDQAIAAGVPEELIGKIIYNVDPSAMGANIKFIGTFEGKVALLKMFARRRNAILFFDEAKMYVEMGKAGDGDGGRSGNTLFELCLQDFSNKSLRAVFATTTTEYNTYFLTNPDLKAFLRRVKEIRLKAYGPEDVKIALASIYPALLEDKQIVRFDMTGAREVTVTNADGTTRKLLIPRFIEDLVNSVATTEDVQKNPNLLMDYSIKKLKEIADLALSDFSNGHTSYVLAENVDGRLPLLIKRKISLQSEIKGYETELAPLKDELGRVGTVFGYNIVGWSRLRREGVSRGRNVPLIGGLVRGVNRLVKSDTGQKIAELEALIAAKKAELKQVEDQINEISGDPNLIPIYEARLTDTQNTINAARAMIDTASMTKAQREAAMRLFTELFGEPNGKYFQVVSEIHVLNDQIRALLTERETLLKPIVSELAMTPSEKWDEVIRAKLGPAAAERIQAIEKQLNEDLGPKVAALEGENQEVMQQHELLLYQSGQKSLSPLEVARYKKTIADLEKKKAKYEEKLAQLRQAQAYLKPGKPQGIVMGTRAFEYYYPKTLTKKEDSKESKADPALVQARSAYSEVVPDFAAHAESADNPKEVAKSFYTYISASQDPQLGLIKAEYVQFYRWLYDLDPATGRPMRGAKSASKPLEKAREQILQTYIGIRGAELQARSVPKALSQLPIGALLGLSPEMVAALTAGLLQIESSTAAAAKEAATRAMTPAVTKPETKIEPDTEPPTEEVAPPADPLADVKARYVAFPGIDSSAFGSMTDQASLNKGLYDALEPALKAPNPTLARFASEYRLLYRSFYEQSTALDMHRDEILKEFALARLAEIESGGAPKSASSLFLDITERTGLDESVATQLIGTGLTIDRKMKERDVKVGYVVPPSLSAPTLSPALSTVSPSPIPTGPQIPTGLATPSPVNDPSLQVNSETVDDTLPSTSTPSNTVKPN